MAHGVVELCGEDSAEGAGQRQISSPPGLQTAEGAGQRHISSPPGLQICCLYIGVFVDKHTGGFHKVFNNNYHWHCLEKAVILKLSNILTVWRKLAWISQSDNW
jgi:hypothetical protein